MGQPAIISDLILAAADGAGKGVEELQDLDIPVELEEFEIEVTYAAETEIKQKSESDASLGLEFKFVTLKSKVGHTRSSRSKATYGLKVRFLFSGKETEAE